MSNWLNCKLKVKRNHFKAALISQFNLEVQAKANFVISQHEQVLRQVEASAQSQVDQVRSEHSEAAAHLHHQVDYLLTVEQAATSATADLEHQLAKAIIRLQEALWSPRRRRILGKTL